MSFGRELPSLQVGVPLAPNLKQPSLRDMRISLSPSPSPSAPTSPSRTHTSPRTHRKSSVSASKKASTPRPPDPPNRFGVRDSDISDTSEEDEDSSSDQGKPNKARGKSRTPRGTKRWNGVGGLRSSAGPERFRSASRLSTP